MSDTSENGRANYLGAQASLPASFGQPVIARNPAGKDGRRSQVVCPTFAPRFSSFQGVATSMKGPQMILVRRSYSYSVSCDGIISCAPVILFGGWFRVLKKLETQDYIGASLESLTEKSTSRCFFKGVSSCKAAVS
jgi:hypothetical protein